MGNASFMLISLVLFNFVCLQNSFGRFILVEVDQKEATIDKSESGTIKRTIHFAREENILFNIMMFNILSYYILFF